MKKTIIALIAISGMALGETKTEIKTIAPGNNVVLDSSVEYRLDWDCRGEGTGHSFEVTTTGDQKITGFNGYNLDELASSSITFNLGGKMTFTGGNSGDKLKDGITLTLNMGTNGSWYSDNTISFVGGDTKLNLTTTTGVSEVENGLFTRSLISAGELWYITNLLDAGNITFADVTLVNQGYKWKGIYYGDALGNLYTGVTKDGNGTVTGLDATTKVGALGAGEYALVITDKASSVQLMVNVVPEPATATLSLLALAGLAVRRRRK